MAKFIVYNVQLLPTTTKAGNVGGSGYKKLLALLRALNNKHRREKTLHLFHRPLTKDIFFGPSEFNVAAGYVYGYFVKYTRTNLVSDLNRGKIVFQNKTKSTTVSRETRVAFLFNTRTHYLAIDGGAGIKTENLTGAIKALFEAAKGEEFPEHELHINLVASAEDVDAILSAAVGFKKITVDLTFQNGGGKTQEFLREMRASRTQRLRVEASGGTGRIAKLPSFMDEMIRAAALVGSLHLTYYLNDTPRKQTYSSEDSPLSFVVRWSGNDDDTRYFQRVKNQLSELTLHAEQEADAVHESSDDE
ncbi:hypothetical protein J2W39_004519 [Variovorax paradoxus]|uniref:Uncharacterized protein n=1 Tax=Variovorax paradoxus TaxID=34073 RepID=A0AAW8EKB8_VARPD|nr:DUF4747 family protein [Variovorax paradoxus]MDP9973272.1 hypothetical protein [Variovorax paradoxus]